jgi:glycosyltransferase involved in cell wall biosynthesis
MISILIPTYNHNIYPLVTEIHKQCVGSGVEFEILCQDDASVHYLTENQNINNISNCQFFISDKNSGRTSARNKLANKAIFKWLLFLDADVIPVNSDFIAKYISFIDDKYQVVFGGYCYSNDTKPKYECRFRYKYGKAREERTALERNSEPYKYIFSGNLLIEKETFIATNYPLKDAHYGMDIYFIYQLFINKIKIFHIENPIYHLGLETNQTFFEKSLKAVESRKQFLIHCDQIEKISPLIKHYKTIKQYGLLPLAILFFKISEPILKKLILKRNPSLFCFDIYRLGYLCQIKNK